MFGYNNFKLIKQTDFFFRENKLNVVWIILIKIVFECIITKMNIVECIRRSILNVDILFNLNK